MSEKSQFIKHVDELCLQIIDQLRQQAKNHTAQMSQSDNSNYAALNWVKVVR